MDLSNSRLQRVSKPKPCPKLNTAQVAYNQQNFSARFALSSRVQLSKSNHREDFEDEDAFDDQSERKEAIEQYKRMTNYNLGPLRASQNQKSTLRTDQLEEQKTFSQTQINQKSILNPPSIKYQTQEIYSKQILCDEQESDQESDEDDWFTKGRKCKLNKNGVPQRQNQLSKAQPVTQDTKTKTQSQNKESDDSKDKEKNSPHDEKNNKPYEEKAINKEHPYLDEELTLQEFMDMIFDKLKTHEGPVTMKTFKEYVLPKYRKASFGELSRFVIVQQTMLSK